MPSTPKLQDLLFAIYLILQIIVQLKQLAAAFKPPNGY